MRTDETGNQEAGIPAYSWYVLFIFLLFNIFSYFDRHIPYILFESLKKDFALSDGQLGLLMGLGFSIAQAVSAPLLGWLADRTSRTWVTAGSLFVWSAMTAAGGAARNFTHLLASRMGVAIGEAGGLPASMAILTETFPLRMRARVFGIMAMAAPVGQMASLAIGGWLHDLVGWRATMVIVGLPGIVLAFVVLLTIKDRRPVHVGLPPAKRPFSAVIFELVRDPAFRNATLGCTFVTIALSGMLGFAPPFLIRVQGMRAVEVGLILGPMIGITGIVGSLASGVLADLAAGRDPGRLFVPTIIGFAIAVPFYVAAWMASTGAASLMLLVVPLLAAFMFSAPTHAAIQTVAAPEDRATAVAIFLMFVGLIGNGGGPTITGFLSDFFAQWYGGASLRYALTALTIPLLLAAVHFYLAGRALGARAERLRTKPLF